MYIVHTYDIGLDRVKYSKIMHLDQIINLLINIIVGTSTLFRMNIFTPPPV